MYLVKQILETYVEDYEGSYIFKSDVSEWEVETKEDAEKLRLKFLQDRDNCADCFYDNEKIFLKKPCYIKNENNNFCKACVYDDDEFNTTIFIIEEKK